MTNRIDAQRLSLRPLVIRLPESGVGPCAVGYPVDRTGETRSFPARRGMGRTA